MRIGIVGGGATGLTAAYRLSGSGHDVVLFESGDKIGGLVETVTVGSDELESFYHHIFTSDTRIINMIDELGLTEKLQWFSPKNGIYINRKLYPFTSPMDLMRFKELSLLERFRMGLLIPKAKFIKDWSALEPFTSEEWITKNAGRNVYEKVWNPLMVSKFDLDSDAVSAVWVWNKFKLRGTSRGKNLNKELLGYMAGSFSLIYKAMAEELEKKGGKIKYSTPVTRIEPCPDGMLQIHTENLNETFDKVIVATAPRILTNIVPSLPSWYVEKLDKIRYKSNICMLIEVRERLSDYYWITVAEKDSPFVLVIEHTNLVKTDRYGSHIIYLSRYIDENNELFLLPDEAVSKYFINYLKKMFPEWNESSIIRTQVNRAKYAQPVIFKNYSGIKPEFETPIPNLYLASMAQIYPEDRGQNYSIALGEELFRRLVKED